ncbi:MAG: DoxX family protein [Fulvivirga sp.]|nr:DoxX family protein [Fulvivirga sp.]
MKDKILLVSTILFGLMMVNSGLNKFLNFMPQPEMSQEAMGLMSSFAASGWMFPLIAVIEITGGVLIAIPRYRALGAIIILPITAGIFLFHLVLEHATLLISIILLAINVWVIVENRSKYLPMINTVPSIQKQNA